MFTYGDKQAVFFSFVLLVYALRCRRCCCCYVQSVDTTSLSPPPFVLCVVRRNILKDTKHVPGRIVLLFEAGQSQVVGIAAVCVKVSPHVHVRLLPCSASLRVFTSALFFCYIWESELPPPPLLAQCLRVPPPPPSSMVWEPIKPQ